MTDEAWRIAGLERRLRLTVAGLVVAVSIAAISLFWSPPTAQQRSSDRNGPLTVPGGATLEVVGRDLRITLPSALSSIVLQAPGGQEIARLGHPRPERVGE